MSRLPFSFIQKLSKCFLLYFRWLHIGRQSLKSFVGWRVSDCNVTQAFCTDYQRINQVSFSVCNFPLRKPRVAQYKRRKFIREAVQPHQAKKSLCSYSEQPSHWVVTNCIPRKVQRVSTSLKINLFFLNACTKIRIVTSAEGLKMPT